MKFKILFLALFFSCFSWGQTTIYTSACTAASPSWVYNKVTVAQPIQQGGYWLLEDSDNIVSEPFNVSSYTSGLSLSFVVGTYGASTPNAPVFVEYSEDNGLTSVSYTHLDVYKRQVLLPVLYLL